MGEALIQRNIIKYLKSRGFKVYKISDRFRAGIPDLYAARDGWSVWIEVKAPAGKLTKLQELELEQLRAAGIPAMVARSVEDVSKMLARVAAYNSHRRLPGVVPAPAHVEHVNCRCVINPCTRRGQ